MKEKNVLVTGACGYIGRHVVRALSNRGLSVVAVDITTSSIVEGCAYFKGDILHDKSFVASLPTCDVCLHLAWQDGFNHNAASHLRNLDSHFSFLMSQVEKGCKHLAVMGSMHEVGYWEGAIKEDTPCNPLSYYGIAKNALRQALFVALKGKDVKFQWLRGYYIYGDDKSNHSVFTKLLEVASQGKNIFPFTSGRNKYDFIDVHRLADMIATTVDQDEVLGIINCCTGEPKSLGDVVESFIRDNHLNIKLNYGAYPDRPYDSPGVWGDASRINVIMKGA